jgi:hypothetical protein
VPKKAQITQERVEYNVFLFDEPAKGSKSLKIFKINLTFRFDKLSNLSKSVHTGENSQILTVSNKNSCLFNDFVGHFKTRVKRAFLKAHECQKRPNLQTNELNTTFFRSTSPLKAPNRLKSLKLA